MQCQSFCEVVHCFVSVVETVIALFSFLISTTGLIERLFDKFRIFTIDCVHCHSEQVLNQCREYDEMIADYETLTSDLLEWIKRTIETLNDRVFPNSLAGVQNMMSQFNSYRTLEKPPKFVFLFNRISGLSVNGKDIMCTVLTVSILTSSWKRDRRVLLDISQFQVLPCCCHLAVGCCRP